MLRRLVKDESGVALGLAVIMILLIGVMGAGLLTFVRQDLLTVVEVNQGQKALNIADAGVQAAKAQLRVDSFRQHYDTTRANDCDEGPRVGVENWSKATDIYTDPSGYCTTTSTRAANQVGVTRPFAGGKFTVTIECFDQKLTPTSTSVDSPCPGGAGAAPEPDTPASDKKFFKITSTGYDTTTGNGAVRKIEAIYHTSKKVYLPVAYYTPKNITFDGTSCVSRMSFFAGGNISGTTSGGGCNLNSSANNVPSGTIADRGTPAIYTDWLVPTYNNSQRMYNGAPATGAGFGALGFVCGGQTCSSASNSNANGFHDYDSTTATKGQNKRFVNQRGANGNQISFPFDPGNSLTDPSSLVPPDLLEELISTARLQNNYVSTTGTYNVSSWPGKGSLVFVDGATTVDFRVNTGTQAEGVLVVRGGNFKFSNSSTGFRGVIIVIGNGNCAENAGGTGNYTSAGGVPLNGYVAASGCLNIKGNVSPSTTIDYTNLLTLFDIKLWSWRELYQ